MVSLYHDYWAIQVKRLGISTFNDRVIMFLKSFKLGQHHLSQSFYGSHQFFSNLKVKLRATSN